MDHELIHLSVKHSLSVDEEHNDKITYSKFIFQVTLWRILFIMIKVNTNLYHMV